MPDNVSRNVSSPTPEASPCRPSQGQPHIAVRLIWASGLGLLITGLATLYGAALMEWEGGPAWKVDFIDPVSPFGWWSFHFGAILTGFAIPFRGRRGRWVRGFLLLTLVMMVDVLLVTRTDARDDALFRTIVPIWRSLLRHAHFLA